MASNLAERQTEFKSEKREENPPHSLKKSQQFKDKEKEPVESHKSLHPEGDMPLKNEEIKYAGKINKVIF